MDIININNNIIKKDLTVANLFYFNIIKKLMHKKHVLERFKYSKGINLWKVNHYSVELVCVCSLF